MNKTTFGIIVFGIVLITGILITLYLTGKFCGKNEVIHNGKCVCVSGTGLKTDGTCGSCESGQGITNGVCGVCKNNEEIKDDGSCGVCGSGYNFDSSSKKCILNTTVSINYLIQSLTNDINQLTPITLTII